MNYSTLNANLSNTPTNTGAPIANKNTNAPKTLSISYNKPNFAAPSSERNVTIKPANSSTSNVPNTLVMRDNTGSSRFSSLTVTNDLNVSDCVNVSSLNVCGTAVLNGTIDTRLGAGIVCSSSTGILSSRLITSGDIANCSIDTIDIKNDAITSQKLAPNLRLEGAPTCLTTTNCSEANIANVGYVNRYVNAYVNKRIKCLPSRRPCAEEGITDNNDDSDSDVDEFDPTIFHIVQSNYVVIFNYGLYIVENPNVTIKMPRKKREGYFVKFVNKSGALIYINSDEDRLMYNATYAYEGTTQQMLTDNKCMVLTIIYKKNGNRSWSFDYY